MNDRKLPLEFDGCYEVQIILLIKTFGKEFTEQELWGMIDKGLNKIEDFRDVQTYGFEIM